MPAAISRRCSADWLADLEARNVPCGPINAIDRVFDDLQVRSRDMKIAMGHPLGATGAMVLGTLVDEMERRDLETGLVTLCIGAGMGTATIIERV